MTTARPDPGAPAAPPPVLMLHSTFGHGGLLDAWRQLFEAAGHECHTPSLPGRLPTDTAALRRLGIRDYLDAVLEYRARIATPPIVIGHSMGGLLAQQLAARTPTAALVLLASVPPGVLWAQPRALPHLARLLPRILTGRPIRPSEDTLRAIVFNDLPEDEQRTLAPQLVTDSGRAFRSLVLGTARVPRDAVTCPVLCVSGGADRNVSPRTSRSIAARYGAAHQVHPERGHWIVAGSVADQVAPPVLDWLRRVGVVDARPHPTPKGSNA
ncbi:MAG: alpha/beta hydrolase [Pseudonocardia sp.]